MIKNIKDYIKHIKDLLDNKNWIKYPEIIIDEEKKLKEDKEQKELLLKIVNCIKKDIEFCREKYQYYVNQNESKYNSRIEFWFFRMHVLIYEQIKVAEGTGLRNFFNVGYIWHEKIDPCLRVKIFKEKMGRNLYELKKDYLDNNCNYEILCNQQGSGIW